MKTIDTKGLKCPQPLVMARKALKEVKIGESFKLVTDNDNSRNNLERFLSDNRISYSVNSRGGIHTFTITSNEGQVAVKAADDYCDTEPVTTGRIRKGLVVVFNAESMGSGNDDLGLILTRSFLASMFDSDRIPEAVLLYNSGVKLAVKDSLVLKELSNLVENGTILLLCGTCVSFYNLKDKIAIGQISNMLEITEWMTGASSLIYS